MFKTSLLEFIAFRRIPAICLQEEQSLKITENKINSRKGLPATKSVTFQKLIPGNIFPDPL